MANKFKAGMTNFVEVLNQMWDAFVAGPYNALSLAGGTLTGALQVPVLYVYGQGAAEPRLTVGDHNGEPAMELLRWSGQGGNDLSWQMKNDNGILRFSYTATGRGTQRVFEEKMRLVSTQYGGVLGLGAVECIRQPVNTVSTGSGSGWMKIAKIKLGLQGGDIVIRVSGTTSYDAKPSSSSGSLTTILARIDNDNKVRGSFHTEVPHAFSAPGEVIFGTDGSVYMLVANYFQLSVHVDAHPLCWEPQPIAYHSAPLSPPDGIYAIKQWGLRVGNDGHSLHVTATDLTSTCNIRAQYLIPTTDNLYDVGLPAQAYRTIYARTGTINTSDARLKCDWLDLTAAEIAAACALARAVRSYRWIDSVSDKGDAARRHIGPTVQDAIKIMEAHDLDPFSYGFICHDAWEREVIEHPAIAARVAVPPAAEIPAVLGDAGDVLMPAVPATPGYPAIEARDAYTEVIREAGDRYAFRYAELSMFISAGQAAQQGALELRIAALEAA